MKSLDQHAEVLVVLSLSLALLGTIAHAQTERASKGAATLSAADTYFASQTSLGTPFQVDSGKLAQTKGTTEAIRSYAKLMVSSHITVDNSLQAILKRKSPLPPPTLLHGAYVTIISTLQRDAGKTFDDDYVTSQVNYQKCNANLYRFEIANGSDPDLKAFAKQTLPKIQDHMQKALKLQNSAKVATNAGY